MCYEYSLPKVKSTLSTLRYEIIKKYQHDKYSLSLSKDTMALK